MNQNRPAALGLTILFMLVMTGCAMTSPHNMTQPATQSEAQSTSALDPATESVTETMAGDSTAKAGDDDANQSIFDVPANLDGFVELSPDQLHQILPEHKFTLVDVHIPYEGELPQTDLFIPFNQIKDHLAELPDKGAPVVLYCRSGPMSTQAAKVLVGLGYTHVYELQGGFDAWGAANYEILKKQ